MDAAVGNRRPRRLTPKQERFARLVATGKADSLADAYAKTYDVESTNKKTHYSQGSRLANMPAIATRIERIRNSMRVPTVEEHIADLDEVRQLAIEKDQLSAAVKATEMQGRAGGLYVERSVTEYVQRLPDDDVRQSLIQAIQSDPQMRQAFIEWLCADADMRRAVSDRLNTESQRQTIEHDGQVTGSSEPEDA